MGLSSKDFFLIGIVGHMNSGKSTAARFFTDNGLFEIGFSHAMKEAMQVMAIPTTRENMQRFGTEIMRTHWNNGIWLRAIEERIQGWIDLDQSFYERRQKRVIQGIVIPDVRFYNEFEWVIAQGGFMVGLVADTQTLYKRACSRPDRDPPRNYEAFLMQLEHRSEKQINQILRHCHCTIQSNHRGPAGLHKDLEKIVWPRILEFYDPQKWVEAHV